MSAAADIKARYRAQGEHNLAVHEEAKRRRGRPSVPAEAKAKAVGLSLHPESIDELEALRAALSLQQGKRVSKSAAVAQAIAALLAQVER